MPELPEVETITRELSRVLVGKKLNKFSVFDTKKISRPRIPLPSRVLGVSRRGKYIIFDLDCGRQCLIHLRMTGGLLLKMVRRGSPRAQQSTRATKLVGVKQGGKSGLSPEKHERARFCFSGGSVLHFFDTRRFGTIDWPKHGVLPNLGIEPFSKEFKAKTLAKLFRNSRRPIKNFLLDQKKIAGIGNIYADEALWLAKIHPKRRSGDLSAAEAEKLALAIKKILREAIKKGGFTLRDYRRTGGESGYYQHSRKVYDREGLPCLRCRAKIKRIKIGGRSSYFCPKCQK